MKECNERLNDKDIELMRKQLKNGNAQAKKVAIKRGYKLDPRIAAALMYHKEP